MEPSATDRFLANLTVLYKQYSIQFQFVITSFFSWLLSLPATCAADAPNCTSLTTFMSHLWIPAWTIPFLVSFLPTLLLKAIPQPKPAAEAEQKAMAKAADKLG